MIATLIQVAKEMARYEGKKRSWDQERVILHRLCESAIKGKNVPKVAVLDVTNRKVHLEDYKDDERYKYLYALSTGKHAIGPSWFLDFRKAEDGKRHTGGARRPKKSRKELIQTGIREIRASVTIQEERVWEDLALQLTELTKNELFVLMTIMQDGKMPGERDNFRERFIRKKILGERRAASKGNGRCAACSKETSVSSIIPFRFFTVEKLGFSPMGHEEQVWKYAPLCEECAKWLYVAESYLQENLSTRVAGKPTYLVPDLEPEAAKIEGSFVHFLWEWRERTKGKTAPEGGFPNVEGEQPDALTNLFKGLVEESEGQFKAPFRSASLIFYQPGQKFMLLYAISEILPINLRKAKQRLAGLRKLLRENVLGEGGAMLAPRLQADFEFVGRAWKWPRRGQSDSQGTLKFTPMHLVETILTDQRLPQREFWQDTDSLLRATYQETIGSKDQKQSVQSALADRARLIWAIWALAYRSKEIEGGANMTTQTMAQATSPGVDEEFWESFFQPRMLLDSASKRAVFLVGVLFGRVESRQRSERQSKAGEMPIISRLRGLALSQTEMMMKLLPELMLKLRQLDSNTRVIQAIQQAAAHYASQNGKLSDEEARFCFCLGWALSWTTVEAVREALGVPPSEEEVQGGLSGEER